MFLFFYVLVLKFLLIIKNARVTSVQYIFSFLFFVYCLRCNSITCRDNDNLFIYYFILFIGEKLFVFKDTKFNFLAGSRRKTKNLIAAAAQGAGIQDVDGFTNDSKKHTKSSGKSLFYFLTY